MAVIALEEKGVQANTLGLSVTMQLRTLFAPDARAAERFMEFFSVHIENAHTRRAYYRSAGAFSMCCTARGIHRLADARPMHIAAYIK